MILFNVAYFKIYCALVYRDLVSLKKQIMSDLLDAIIQVTVYVISFGHLFPIMGLPREFVAPLFIGSVALQILFLGMGFGTQIIFDLKFHRFIDYQRTLPIPKRWLFAALLTNFCIKALLICIPVFLGGVLFLGPLFNNVHMQLIPTIMIAIVSLIFYGTLFLALSFYYTFDWFMNNVWPRRLTILLGFAPMFYLWNPLYQKFPLIGIAMLANPLTFTAEGLRATIIGGDMYLPALLCFVMIIMWIMICIFFASIGIKRRLDPV